MRLAYLADGRSPIALQWIRYFVEAGHEVHLLSTFPCKPELRLASLEVFPVAFSGARGRGAADTGMAAASALLGAGGAVGSGFAAPGGVFGVGGIGLRTFLRHWFGPLTVPAAARRVRQALERIRPELVHAMRVPFEGMLAAAADPAAPLLISVWGNDFTLHAPASPGMRRLTRRALARADGLHCDCRRDLRLAERWGLRPGLPSEVIPGNGGVRREDFFPARAPQAGASPQEATLGGPGVQAQAPSDFPLRMSAGAASQHPPGWERIPSSGPLIVNPRGFRAYVRNDSFFRAIPRVLQHRPDARFVCPAMAGARPALRWIARLGIQNQVLLLPPLGPAYVAALFRRAHASVSPSEHDGTPNTLLEAMACGCLPVASDLESIREWIEPGLNGLLFNPADPEELALAVLQALADGRLRASAAELNEKTIAQRATYETGMAKAELLYRRLVLGG